MVAGSSSPTQWPYQMSSLMRVSEEVEVRRGMRKQKGRAERLEMEGTSRAYRV